MNDILTKLNDFMYTYVLIIMLVAVGVYFTIRTRGVQILPVKRRDQKPDGKEYRGRERKEKSVVFSGADDLDGFPCRNRKYRGNCDGDRRRRTGAVFWMWLMAVIGGAFGICGEYAGAGL